MEGCFLDDAKLFSRVDADRHLREYGRMDSILRSSQSYGRRIGDLECLDDTAILAQMYSLRSCILEVDDPRERMLLYHHYIKGRTVDTCANLIGVSPRTAYRLKNSALDSVAIILNRKNASGN